MENDSQICFRTADIKVITPFVHIKLRIVQVKQLPTSLRNVQPRMRHVRLEADMMEEKGIHCCLVFCEVEERIKINAYTSKLHFSKAWPRNAQQSLGITYIEGNGPFSHSKSKALKPDIR